MAWAVLPVAGVLVLAGCGDDDDKDESKASNTPSAAAQNTGTATAPAGGAAPSSSAPAAVNSATFTADQKAAAEAYMKVFDAKNPVDERKAYIQDASKINAMLDAMLSNPLVSQVSVKTNDVKINGDSGTVNFEVIVAGGASPLAAYDGAAVKQDGKWKVGAKTICTLAGIAQVPAAPECSSY
jgi:hypothetical protein